jgi:hypothetical protein
MMPMMRLSAPTSSGKSVAAIVMLGLNHETVGL